jgi:hypothetical protein
MEVAKKAWKQGGTNDQDFSVLHYPLFSKRNCNYRKDKAEIITVAQQYVTEYGEHGGKETGIFNLGKKCI